MDEGKSISEYKYKNLKHHRYDLREQKIFIFLLGLIGLAWLTLLIYGESPYGIFINHDIIMLNDSMIIIFVISWTIMIIAMMLPSSLPLILMFKLMVDEKNDKLKLILLLIIGYLFIWMIFGIIIHFIDWIIHYTTYNNNISLRSWLVSAIILMTAGLYQFTNLKYYCVNKCRSPKNFIISHWQGGNEKLNSFRLGIDHGIFCIGCCWSIMILMFLVGIGNIGWMLVLTIIMTMEKNYFGRWFGKVIGILLIGLSILSVIL